jgi:Zn-dependent peptidase ImmA (M78 family)/transcriptional regulator with XRE-family HTH domain
MTTQDFRPAMLVLARESRGLTQTELAPLVGVSQAMLSKMEAGAKLPGEGLLERLAEVLQYPAEFFLQPDTVFGPGLSEFYHRKRQDVGVKVLAKVHAQINIITLHLSRLLRSVDLPETKIKFKDLAEFGGRPQNVARAVRAEWQMADGPVPNVIRVIEDSGGIVIRVPFGSPRIDAISRLVPGLPPLFFVNDGLPTDRERLTLCHELGHLVMHDLLNPNMETEANQFAAEFLMPARDCAPHLERVSMQRLAALKPYWRVSMAALLVRATDLRKVSQRSAQVLWMQMAPYRRQEPPELDLAPETPLLFREILDLHRNTFGFGLSDFAGMLCSRPAELVSLYGLGQSASETRSRLRLIRNPDRSAAG